MVYCSISAQEDKLGDIEIRSMFVDWLLEMAHAIAGAMFFSSPKSSVMITSTLLMLGA